MEIVKLSPQLRERTAHALRSMVRDTQARADAVKRMRKIRPSERAMAEAECVMRIEALRLAAAIVERSDVEQVQL